MIEMKHVRLFLFMIVASLGVSAPAYAQDGPPPGDAPNDERENERRPNLLAELGLSPEQVQQIRRINQGRRPLMMDAQRRMREANRDLDMAIYASDVSDADFQTRLKAFQSAQAEVVRLRFESELAIRRVLTPEQLIRFRELRQKFTEARRTDNGERRRHRRDGLRPRGGSFRRPLND